MPKRKKVRKHYNANLKKQTFNQNDRTLGKIKVLFLLVSVAVVGVLVISKINSWQLANDLDKISQNVFWDNYEMIIIFDTYLYFNML